MAASGSGHPAGAVRTTRPGTPVTLTRAAIPATAKEPRTATLMAAAGLYGPGSIEYGRVAAAWTAVNVR
ncbi:hypothetical protein [Streptomyces katrae]|uniref:hypothetical protein n=1 Tax=Streptomyces katrae TaxID=68223 RepID=UPI000AD37174|nr:hypothetical protein [Streptomyces katrae]